MDGDKENEVAKRASQRWSILRRAIAKSNNDGRAAEGSIHQFAGFGFLHRRRLPSSSVSRLQDLLTTIRLSVDDSILLITQLELSLLALTALKPANWVWEICIHFPCHENAVEVQTGPETAKLLAALAERLRGGATKDRQGLRLGEGSGWLAQNDDDCSRILKIVLAPFLPSHAIFQYSLPSFDCDGNRINDTILLTRERHNTAPSSLQELTSHHHHRGVDNTGNICVWDSEQTMAFSLLKLLAMRRLPWWPQSTDENDPQESRLTILELGAGMAGLAGLALVQRHPSPSRLSLWVTDGHPRAVQNNRVHAHLILQQQQPPNQNCPFIDCLVLPWSMDPPSHDCPPPCHVALVSDCTHFQEFHAHLLFTLAYGVKVHGYVYLCQPHRGKSLERFLDVVRATTKAATGPLFSIDWLDHDIPELQQAEALALTTNPKHYNPNIHYPHLLLLRKLRNVEEADHCRVQEHMRNRNQVV